MTIKKGTTRIVFIFKNYVYKIPNFTYSWRNFVRGLLSNIDENDTWKASPILAEGDKSYLLCPVKWLSFGGWILKMRKVDRVLTEEEDDKYDISEHRLFFGGDDTVSNYGFLSGKLVKIDYY